MKEQLGEKEDEWFSHSINYYKNITYYKLIKLFLKMMPKPRKKKIILDKIDSNYGSSTNILTESKLEKSNVRIYQLIMNV